MAVTQLNFPSYDHKLKTETGKEYIWDIVRESWVVLTPEEWVRQNLIAYLIVELKYPRGLMQVESSIKVGTRIKRFDLVVMDKQLKPWLICECKAPAVSISSEALQQASIYNSQLQCPYLAVTNGLDHFCFLIDFTQQTTKKLEGFPSIK